MQQGGASFHETMNLGTKAQRVGFTKNEMQGRPLERRRSPTKVFGWVLQSRGLLATCEDSKKHAVSLYTSANNTVH